MSVTNAIRNPRAYIERTLWTYYTILFDPETFFDELDEGGLRKEVLLVLSIGIVGAIGPYYAYQRLMTPFCTGAICQGNEPTLTSEAPFRFQGKVMEPILIAFGVWISFTVALYVLSWFYSEQGGIRQVLKNTAWGMVPLFFANLVRSIGFVVAAWGVDVEGNLETNPDSWFAAANAVVLTSEQVQIVWRQVAADPAVIGATVLSLVFLIWAGYVWGHGIADARYIDPRQGYRVAAIPIGVYALITLISLGSTVNII